MAIGAFAGKIKQMGLTVGDGEQIKCEVVFVMVIVNIQSIIKKLKSL